MSAPSPAGRWARERPSPVSLCPFSPFSPGGRSLPCGGRRETRPRPLAPAFGLRALLALSFLLDGIDLDQTQRGAGQPQRQSVLGPASAVRSRQISLARHQLSALVLEHHGGPLRRHAL